MIYMDMDGIYFCWYGGGLFVLNGDILVNGIFEFYVLVVHGKPTDS